jgi:hypothetical protein
MEDVYDGDMCDDDETMILSRCLAKSWIHQPERIEVVRSMFRPLTGLRKMGLDQAFVVGEYCYLLLEQLSHMIPPEPSIKLECDSLSMLLKPPEIPSHGDHFYARSHVHAMYIYTPSSRQHRAYMHSSRTSELTHG